MGNPVNEPPTESPGAAALSPGAQFELAEEWFQFLNGDASREYPVPNALKCAWEDMGACGVLKERGKRIANISGTPLGALFYYVEMGFYPPPELLLALSCVFNKYIDSNGDVTLERAFLGPPIPKSGNYARRSNAKLRKGRASVIMTRLISEGMSRDQAAEVISMANGGKPDADSIKRTVKPFVRRKEEK